eukprot:4298528-Pyramimonas_sp.AAC.1
MEHGLVEVLNSVANTGLAYVQIFCCGSSGFLGYSVLLGLGAPGLLFGISSGFGTPGLGTSKHIPLTFLRRSRGSPAAAVAYPLHMYLLLLRSSRPPPHHSSFVSFGILEDSGAYLEHVRASKFQRHIIDWMWFPLYY